MFGLLPLAALALFVIAARARGEPWPGAALLGAIAWGTVLTVLTETLGAAGAITHGALGMVWSAIVLGLGAWLLHVWRARGCAVSLRVPLAAAGRDRWLLLPVALVASLTLVIALAAPPNTFDTMAYHMARVAHWGADGSVDNYPTAILRQLHMAPFAEYAVLHLYVLADGDRLANLVQWLAMLGSVAAAAAAARELCGGHRAMLYAAVFCATLPIGILEASATKNDYVVAFWIAAAAWLVLVLTLRPPEEARRRHEYWLALGAAVGLATLTKATAYLFTAPLLVWLAVGVLRRPDRRTLAGAAAAAVLALTLNGAFFARNVDLHGSPFGPTVENDEHRYANERLDLQVLASNVLRNAALQVATGWRPADALITRAVLKAHRILAIDPALPQTTWMGIEFDAHQRWRHEDSAPNPLHFLLLLAAPVALLAWRGPRTGAALGLLAAVVAGFLLFCGYLQWQPWHSRLHLPLLVLAAPVAGLAIARIPRPAAGAAVAFLLTAAAAPALLANESRPLLAARNVLNTPRSDQYFANWPAMAGVYSSVSGRLGAAGCRDVALVAWWNAYEYPLWALGAGGAPIRVRHVAVANPSARYAEGAATSDEPCALVALARHETATAWAAARRMRRVLDDGGVMLFLASPVRADAPR